MISPLSLSNVLTVLVALLCLWPRWPLAGTLVAGGHFSDFTFGRIMQAEGKRSWVKP